MRAYTYNSLTVLALLLLCVLAFLAVVPAASSTNQFYTHGRYGKRAPGPLGNVARIWGSTGTTGRRRGEVEARADKFFLNSRYGKRTSEVVDPAVLPPEDTGNNIMYFACHYTGVHDLFRCTETRPPSISGEQDAPEQQPQHPSDDFAEQQRSQ